MLSALCSAKGRILGLCSLCVNLNAFLRQFQLYPHINNADMVMLCGLMLCNCMSCHPMLHYNLLHYLMFIMNVLVSHSDRLAARSVTLIETYLSL